MIVQGKINEKTELSIFYRVSQIALAIGFIFLFIHMLKLRKSALKNIKKD